MHIGAIACLVAAVIGVRATAPSGSWDAFNYAPSSKTVRPVAIYDVFGAVDGPDALTSADGSGFTTLQGNGSWVALDFGKEVGGLITLSISSTSATSTPLALSFTESPLFIRPEASDDSAYPSANTTYDGIQLLSLSSPNALFDVGTSLDADDPNFGEDPFTLAPPTPSQVASRQKRRENEMVSWTQPAASLRGGFRYLTLVSTSSEPVRIANVTCAISFAPHIDDLRAYSGYFSAQTPSSIQTPLTDQGFAADPDFLTKLWYAGAYTVQTNTVALPSGRQVPIVPSPGWANNATLGVAGPIIVDGAKRDRAVWPGDMGIAVPTAFVSTNDLLPTRNALSTMFAAIDPKTGALPESGPPLSQLGSDTYHAWTLIGTHNYWLYSGDVDWIETVWANYTKAVAFLEGKVDSSGLMNVTGLRDWARLGGGGHNSEGNALLYKVLTNSVDLANAVNASGAPELATAWANNATALKAVFNAAFWSESEGLYTDNTTTTLCPQDANSFAVVFNLTNSTSQMQSISEGLQRNWNERGAVAPELPDTISPFIGGFELQAHFLAGNDAAAMDMLHREWGWMMYTNLSVQSTLIEGYTANGSIGYRSYRGYNYDPAYTSHAHGWSTGPTSALTYFVLGLQVTSPMGQTWSLSPHMSGLDAAQGGFETPLGWFGASWSVGNSSVTIELDVPPGTSGVVSVPKEMENGVFGKRGMGGVSVQLDGAEREVIDGRVDVAGGKHTVVMHGAA